MACFLAFVAAFSSLSGVLASSPQVALNSTELAPVAANWTIISGNCVVDHNCMQSPNFPGPYNNNGGCVFRAAEGFGVTAHAFHTERFMDTLTVNGIVFSGDCGPQQVLAEGRIVWKSDGTRPSPGWKLCQQERPLQWHHVINRTVNQVWQGLDDCSTYGQLNVISEVECRRAAGVGMHHHSKVSQIPEWSIGTTCRLVGIDGIGRAHDSIVCADMQTANVCNHWPRRLFGIILAIFFALSSCGFVVLHYHPTALEVVQTFIIPPDDHRALQDKIDTPSVVDGAALHAQVPPDRWCVTRSDLIGLRKVICDAIENGQIVPTTLDPFDQRDRTTGPCIHTVTDQFVKPVTAAAGNASWALMIHPEGLPCDLFVSHGWQEGVFEFIDKVVHSWPNGAIGAYCCMFSNPQNLDISGLLSSPRESPFAQALQRAEFVLVVPNCKRSIYTRVWCAYEVFLAYFWNKHIFTASAPSLKSTYALTFAFFNAGLPTGLLIWEFGLTFFAQHSELFAAGYIVAWLVAGTSGIMSYLVMLRCSGANARVLSLVVAFLSGFGGGSLLFMSIHKDTFRLSTCLAGVTSFLFAMLVEMDRALIEEARVESEQLQQGYTGRLQDAESFVASDGDMIMAEIATRSSEEEVNHAVGVLIFAGMSTPCLRTATEKAGQLANLGRPAKTPLLTVVCMCAWCLREIEADYVADDSCTWSKKGIIMLCFAWLLIFVNLGRDKVSFAISGLVIATPGMSVVLISNVFHRERIACTVTGIASAVWILLIGSMLLGPAGTARLPWIGPFIVKLFIGRHLPCHSAFVSQDRTRFSTAIRDNRRLMLQRNSAAGQPDRSAIEMTQTAFFSTNLARETHACALLDTE